MFGREGALHSGEVALSDRKVEPPDLDPVPPGLELEPLGLELELEPPGLELEPLGLELILLGLELILLGLEVILLGLEVALLSIKVAPLGREAEGEPLGFLSFHEYRGLCPVSFLAPQPSRGPRPFLKALTRGTKKGQRHRWPPNSDIWYSHRRANLVASGAHNYIRGIGVLKKGNVALGWTRNWLQVSSRANGA
jgi:hypothetical protein